MLAIAGSIGLGFVWGWLAARRAFRSRWPAAARMLLWILLQALAVGFLASAEATGWFAGSVVFAALLCRAWLRALAARYGDADF